MATRVTGSSSQHFFSNKKYKHAIPNKHESYLGERHSKLLVTKKQEDQSVNDEISYS